MNFLKKLITSLLIVGLVIPSNLTFADSSQIRQEVNITDGYYFASLGAFATSSEVVAIADSNYTQPTYYFEVVASTTASTNATISLVNATSSASIVSVTVNSLTYARYRSAAFTPTGSSTVEYKVVLGKENVGKGIIAARIVILQHASSLVTNTETQIEIGNRETLTSNATTTFASPKYWYYDSSKWNGTTNTFYAEATWLTNGAALASSTIYSNPGTYTVTIPKNTASTTIELYGAGGAGGGTTANGSGGGGGAGGGYAQSIFNLVGGTQHTLFVAATNTPASAGINGPQGASTTWDTNLAVAGGGAGGLINSGLGGVDNFLTYIGNTIRNPGGQGANGDATNGAAGGGGAGPSTAGLNGSNLTGGGGSGGGLAGKGANNITSSGNGLPGFNASGGAGGAFKSSGANRTGGAGAAGIAKITDNIATTTIALQKDDGQFANWQDVVYITVNDTAGTTTRERSPAFVPTDKKHYRIVERTAYNGSSIIIYNAKIIVDQSFSAQDANYLNTFVAGNAEGICATGNTAVAETITAVNSGTLNSTVWYLNTITGSASGNLVSRVYSISGTYGTDAIPTGAVLATSDPVDASTIAVTGTAGLNPATTTFTFSGTNRIVRSATTQYAITVEYLGPTSCASDAIYISYDLTAPVYSGNLALFNGTSWSGFNFYDFDFSTSVGPADIGLEPQYVLANTKYANNTNMQNFINNFDPTEWSTTNNYLHALNSAASSNSQAGIYSTAQVILKGSEINSPNNYATSTSGICMPSTATDIDTKAFDNNNDLYGDAILVQVGVASTAQNCTAATLGTPIVNLRGKNIIKRNIRLK